MQSSEVLQTYREPIRSVVMTHHATNTRVFNSVVRGEDTDESDQNLLIDPTPEKSLLDDGAIRFEINALPDIYVDVLTSDILPYTFCEQILRATLKIQSSPKSKAYKNLQRSI